MQLNDLLLHDTDRKQLKAILIAGVGSLLLEASRGFGKQTVALALANELSSSRTEYITLVEPIDVSITIDQIRKLKSFFTLKTHSSLDRRVAIIANADNMTIEAQNSLLKLLEEPPENCHLILTSSHSDLLLPTINSRVQTVHLRTVKTELVMRYFTTKGYPSIQVNKVLSMTNGLIGITSAILAGEDTSFTDALEHAKNILGQKHIDRLKSVDAIAKDKQSALLLLDAFKTIATAGLRKATKGTDPWKTLLKISSVAEQQLAVNASAKLVFTNLFLSL
jgi:hypothetical protein